jgi:hypothetical protein
MVHDAGFAEGDLEVLNFEERHGFGSLVRASPKDLGDIQSLSVVTDRAWTEFVRPLNTFLNLPKEEHRTFVLRKPVPSDAEDHGTVPHACE